VILTGESRPVQAASADARQPRILVRNLTKRFRSHRSTVLALDNVSLEIGQGEKLVLLGPSGCGKTTLLRCVAGLEMPDEGEIEIDGRLVFSSRRGIAVRPDQRGTSMVFQSYALWPHMTVFDNVAYPLTNMRVPVAQQRERVTAVLQSVGCAAFAQRYPGQLSGGQQQRIALARAVVAREGTILFDEPLSNVDAKVREQLRVELVALQKRLGFTALYVTHDQTEASAFAHRIAVMDMGRIAQFGTPRDIYARPASRHVAEFTGANNELEGVVTGLHDGLLRIDTPVGPLLALHDGQAGPGSEVSLLFRPENLRFASGEGSNRFPVTIESTMFLGLYTEYGALAGAQRLLLRTTHAEEVADGSDAWASIQPEHLGVFPRRA